MGHGACFLPTGYSTCSDLQRYFSPEFGDCWFETWIPSLIPTADWPDWSPWGRDATFLTRLPALVGSEACEKWIYLSGAALRLHPPTVLSVYHIAASRLAVANSPRPICPIHCQQPISIDVI